MSDHGNQPETGEDLVRSQWTRVELLERLPVRDAQSVLAAELHRAHRDATSHLPSSSLGRSFPGATFGSTKAGRTQIRVWHVCQFLSSEDRILDIGMGHGWLSGNIALAATEGIRRRGHHRFEVRLYSGYGRGQRHRYQPMVLGRQGSLRLGREVGKPIDRATARNTRTSARCPTGSLCHCGCHPPSTQLLFSVPILGRIEACWGHVSLFDAHRVANAWQLLLVSRSSSRPARVARLVENAQPAVPVPTRGDTGLALPSDDDPAFHWIRLEPDSLGTASGRRRSPSVT